MVARGEAVGGEEAERLEALLHSSATKDGTATADPEAAGDGDGEAAGDGDAESLKDDDGGLVSQRA